jgi:hypothetical protein
VTQSRDWRICTVSSQRINTNHEEVQKFDLHPITDQEGKMMARIIAIQIFSKNRKNTILLGSLIQDVRKEYQDNFLCSSVTRGYTKLMQIQFPFSD